MTFTIGKWCNMFYFVPTIIWINKSPKCLAITWLKWYIGFDEKLEEGVSMSEKVNHPDHYNISGRKECIVEMEEIFGADAVKTFCKLNAYKYKYRHELKGGQEDLDKAKWYEDYMRQLEPWTCEPCEGSVYLTRESYGELCYKAAKWNELEKCGDAISREDAIKAVCGLCDKSTGIFEENPHIDAVLEVLENLHPVLPESKTEVLDKIRAEIEKYSNSWKPKGNSIDNAGWSACNKCIEIIDKYKAESEGK